MTELKQLSRRDFPGAAAAAARTAWLRAAAPLLAEITQAACSVRDEDGGLAFLEEAGAADEIPAAAAALDI